MPGGFNGKAMTECLNISNVLLLGLPGSGKNTVKKALMTRFELPQEAISVASDWSCQDLSQYEQAWCVIDMRARFPLDATSLAFKQLETMLHNATGVVFSFSEAAELDRQSAWVQWVKRQRPGLPVVRLNQNDFPKSWSGFEKVPQFTVVKCRDSALSNLEHSLETLEFRLDKVSLDHLLMGLDNSRENLGMQIWRVQAVLATYEYENLVAIEGTPFGWDTYAADSGQQEGYLRIKGVGLQKDWLDEIVKASSFRV